MAEVAALATIQTLSDSMHEMRVPCEQLRRRLEFVLAEITRYEVIGDVAETLGQIMSDFDSFLRSHQDLSIVKRAIKRREMVKALSDLNVRVDHLAQEVRQRRPVIVTTSPVRSPIFSPSRSPIASLPGMKLSRPTVDDVIRQLRVIKQHVETLCRGTNYQRENALRALKQFASDPIYRTAVASAGSIWPLVEILEMGSNAEREKVLEILRELLVGRPATRRAIIEVGGLDPLVQLATEGIDTQRKLASTLLRSLSKVYKAAIDEGRDLRSEELKARCRETYLDITPNRANHFAQLVGDAQEVTTSRAAGKAFGIAVFVKLLRSGTEAQADKAVNAIKHIACNDFYDGVDLVAAGAIPVLAHLAAEGTETQRYTAAGSLMALCNSSSTRLARLLHYEAPVFYLPPIGSAQQIEEAVSLVRFFSWEDDDYHSSRTENETVIDIDCDDPTNQKAFALICGVSALVKQIYAGPGDQKEAAAEALCALAEQETVYTEAMVDAGAIEVLVILARDGTQAQTTSALKTLMLIVCENENRSLLLTAAGGVGVLIQRVRDGTNTQQETALKILAIILGSDEHRTGLVDAGGVVVLTQQARDGSDTQKEAALTILKYISRSDDHHVGFVAAGGIPVLVKILQTGSSKHRTIALAVLHNLAQGASAIKRAIVQSGGVLPLVEVSRNGNTNQKAESLETLHDLAHGEKRNAMAIVAAGGTGQTWSFFVDGWKSKPTKPKN